MKKVIVLDLDGTIIDFSIRSYQCYLHCLRSLGIHKQLDLLTYWGLKRARIQTATILGENSHQIGDFHKLWMETIENIEFLDYDNLFPGIFTWLQRATSHHDILLVTRRRLRSNLLTELERLKISSFFKNVINFDDNRSKAQLLSNQSEFPFYSFAFWVGDTEEDILAARELGITSIGLTCGVRNEEVLELYCPDSVASFLSEVSLPGFDC